MAISAMLSGIFLFLFTLSADSKYQVAFSSVEAFTQNIMYGVLYAYTPEVCSLPSFSVPFPSVNPQMSFGRC